MSKSLGPRPGGREFAGVRVDRLVAAGAIGLSAAFLLCGYELTRSVSNSLFVAAYTAHKLPIVMALGPVATLAMIYAYGRLLSAAGPRNAVLCTAAFSALVIAACYNAICAGFQPAAAALYVFREAYIVLLVEQVWSFINSTVRTDEGSKLNGPICGIASLGAIAGGLLAHRFAARIGTANLLPVAVATFAPTAFFALAAYRAGGEPKPAPDEVRGRHGHLGLGALAHEPVLRRLALLIALTQVVSTMADLQLNRWVELEISHKDLRTQWYGGYFAAVNIGSSICQFVAAPLLLAFVPHRLIHVAIPLAHVGVIAAVFARPGLGTAAACYFTFKVLDYSVFRGVKELLYIPLSFDARYRAKELIDAFIYRASKGAAAGALALVGTRMIVPLLTFPCVIAAALAGWLGLAARLTQSVKKPSKPRVPAP